MNGTDSDPGRAAASGPQAVLAPPAADLKRQTLVRRPRVLALLLSALIHALLLGLTFGDQELGLPGFDFPWHDRRISVPELRVVLAPAPAPAPAPAQAQAQNAVLSIGLSWPPASNQQPAVGDTVLARPPSLVSPRSSTAPATAPEVQAERVPKPSPTSGLQTGLPAPLDTAPMPDDRSVDAVAGKLPEPLRIDADVLAMPAAESDPPGAFVAPAMPPQSGAAVSAAPSASSPVRSVPAPVTAGHGPDIPTDPKTADSGRDAAEQDRQWLEAQRLAELEAAQAEASRLETARQEEARRDAAQIELKRLEAERGAVARQQAAADEAARLQTGRLEAERQVSAQLEAARQDAARQTDARRETARLEAASAETARLEAERLEAERLERTRLAAVQLGVTRQEAARQEMARQEMARQEAAQRDLARDAAQRELARQQAETREQATRQEVALQEAARQEAARAQDARREAARQEAARQAEARQESAREASTRQEAARQQAARAESERLEVARQVAAGVEQALQQQVERQQAAQQAAERLRAARVEAEQVETVRRDAARRAMGRQLDEEADRRDAASKDGQLSSTLPSSWSSARRGRLFGRTDPNGELIQYAQAWARKIELNMTFDTVREAAKRPHANPLVTVAIRSDGSVESVTFVLSSGVADIDEAVRRIVQSQAPYQAFAPALARQFDVIEIRRTWHFDMAIRLY